MNKEITFLYLRALLNQFISPVMCLSITITFQIQSFHFLNLKF